MRVSRIQYRIDRLLFHTICLNFATSIFADIVADEEDMSLCSPHRNRGDMEGIDASYLT